MNPNDIKVGDCYPVLAHVGYKNKKGNYGITINWGDGLMETRILTPDDACAMFSIYETKPKYDPCRPFKKGDKVKPREEIQGRKISQFVARLSPGKVYTVINDEFNCTVDVDGDDGLCICSFIHLELVTPVEELEPYRVKESTDYFSVDKEEEEICLFWKGKHPNPKAAARAECALLNEGYRKDQNNGNK